MRRFEFEDTPMADGLPTVTLGDVERAIADVSYTVLTNSSGQAGTTTVCYITLDNGHSVIGSSTCVVAEKFNREIGEKLAYKKAEDEVWALLGYELRLKLSAQ